MLNQEKKGFCGFAEIQLFLRLERDSINIIDDYSTLVGHIPSMKMDRREWIKKRRTFHVYLTQKVS